MFEKILIANRGEIALRIHRACKELGIQTVAVHSTADSEAMHVRLADEAVCIGPPQSQKSYLNIHSILSAAAITGADAIHPGYGFLSENADFADMVHEHGFVFIGPRSDHIRLMGDKITAIDTVRNLGLPVVPGSNGIVDDIEEAVKISRDLRYPVLIKASGGGGGKGMKVAYSESELRHLFPIAKSEAKRNFGNDSVYIEKFLDHPRHIEIQIAADHHGNIVYLGERDCSLQRSHQKVLEEAPSPAINDEIRESIGKKVCHALSVLGYQNLGTVEFLYQDGEFYFIEMNTRLQVEHPVTEMIYGIDLVREQIRISEGLPLSFQQKDLVHRGHAIECRINAEHYKNFTPSPGKISLYHPPGGLGVRVDSGLYTNYTVQPYYDSLIAKLIVHGQNRNECLMRLRRSLGEFVVSDINTTIPLHQNLMQNNDFMNGDYDIHWLEKFVKTIK